MGHIPIHDYFLVQFSYNWTPLKGRIGQFTLHGLNLVSGCYLRWFNMRKSRKDWGGQRSVCTMMVERRWDGRERGRRRGGQTGGAQNGVLPPVTKQFYNFMGHAEQKVGGKKSIQFPFTIFFFFSFFREEEPQVLPILLYYQCITFISVIKWAVICYLFNAFVALTSSSTAISFSSI